MVEKPKKCPGKDSDAPDKTELCLSKHLQRVKCGFVHVLLICGSSALHLSDKVTLQGSSCAS